MSDTQHNNAMTCARCCYAECHFLFTIMLSVIMLNVIMLSVVMLSVVGPLSVRYPILIFMTKAGVYPSGAPRVDYTRAEVTGNNSILDYYGTELMATVKSFTVQVPILSNFLQP